MDKIAELKALIESVTPETPEETKQQLVEAKVELGSLLEEVQKTETEKAELETKVTNLTAEKEALTGNLVEAKDGLEALTKEHQEKLDDFSEQLDGKDAQIKELNEKYEALEKEYKDHLLDLVVLAKLSKAENTEGVEEQLREKMSKDSIDVLKARIEEHDILKLLQNEKLFESKVTVPDPSNPPKPEDNEDKKENGEEDATSERALFKSEVWSVLRFLGNGQGKNKS